MQDCKPTYGELERCLADTQARLARALASQPQGFASSGGSSAPSPSAREAKPTGARGSSETFYREVFASCPTGIALVAPEGQRFLDANPAFLAIVGYTLAELRDLTVQAVTHPEDWAREKELIHARRQHAVPDFDLEKRYVRKDGESRWVRVSGAVVELSTGERVAMASVEDVHARRLADEELRASEARLRSAADASLDSCLTLACERNAEGEIVDFLFDDLNARAEAMLQMRRQDLVGRRMCEVLPIDREAGFFDKYKRVVETGVPLEEEFLLPDTHVPGAWHHHQVVPVGDGIAISHRDITDRKRAEERLRESEQRFRSFVENAHDIVYSLSLDGTLTYVSPNWLAFFGEPAAAAMGKPFLSYVHAEDQARWLEYLADAAKPDAKSRALEVRVRRCDGAWRWYSLEASRWVDGSRGPAGYMGIARDIGESRQAREALKEMAEMLDTAPSSITVHDSTGRFLYANRKTFEIHGYSEAEFMALKLPQLDVPGSAEQIAERMATIEERGEASFEVAHYCKDGSTIPLEVFVKRVHWRGEPAMLSIGTDISERKQAEANRDRLLSAIEQSGELIIITDENGQIQYVNPTFERVTGFTREEAFGRTPRMLKSGEHPSPFYDELWETIKSGRRWHGRFVNRRKDGATYTEEADISPVVDGSGRIINYVAVGRDVTQQVQLELQLRQVQRLEAIGQLTGGVAHDFNNLLQVINGSIELALEDIGPSHPAREQLVEVADAGQRAARLVGQLLLFSRRQVMRKEAVDVNVVVSNLLRIMQRIIGEHIRVVWLPARSLAPVFADAGMVEQVVMNLCVNARDAMTEGGLLTIESSEVDIDEAFCSENAWARPGRFLRLTVTDTGCGMDAMTLDRMYEPFFTTKPAGKGTGLGLATVYGIVKQHDGLLHASSEPRKGSSFSVFLPSGQDVASSATRVVRAARAPGGHETILLAEDDAAVRKLSQQILERAGYAVLVAKDGREALELFERHRSEISLVLLDVVMPELGGRAAYDRMKASCPGLRALFTSGYSEDAVHTDFVLHDGLALIQKPYGQDALLRTIRQLLEG